MTLKVALILLAIVLAPIYSYGRGKKRAVKKYNVRTLKQGTHEENVNK